MMWLALVGVLGGSVALGLILRCIKGRQTVEAWVVVAAIWIVWVIIASADFLIRNSP